MSQPELPMPAPNADSAYYWQCASGAKLVLQQCGACGHKRFPPRHHCPVCWSDATIWVAASGEGTIHAATVVRRPPSPQFRDEVPYVVALIELPEGPRLLTNIIGPNASSAKIGDGVHVRFEQRGDGAVPQFELSEGRSS